MARMETTRFARRRWLLTAASLCAGAARAFDSGPVVLTVGKINFTLAQLRALPQTSFATATPWYPTPRRFTGVLLRDLLAAVGAMPTTIRAVALNDYRVDMPADELVRNGALIACLLDDEPMAVRDKGPLVIMFPFSDRAELRTAVHYGRAVWQLRSLDLR